MQIKGKIRQMPIMYELLWIREVYKHYSSVYHVGRRQFLKENFSKFRVIKNFGDKSKQIVKLMQTVDILPAASNTFFYSIDFYKTVKVGNRILDNLSIDYSDVVTGDLRKKKTDLEAQHTEFARNEIRIIDGLYDYYCRLKKQEDIVEKYKEAISAIGTLFERESEGFFEALQRILFFNQFMWQTKHKHNGFGHLDWLLIDLYRMDIERGRISEAQAKDILKEFFSVLHSNYWFKSAMLLGDTGQIIILGGKDHEAVYSCNELTYLFIQVAMELKLPDPKVLLRCSASMPDDLLELALKCIETGIGAPLLSNDDVVIPALIDSGYEKRDAYNYATSACWEPLILGCSCDQNNIASINFAEPFIEMLNMEDFDRVTSINDILQMYEPLLRAYIKTVAEGLAQLVFEEEPLISLFSKSAYERQKDIVRGGAKYSNLGITSVGMGTVVDSIANIDKLVFKEGKYTVKQMNLARKANFDENEELLSVLKKAYPCFGSDCSEIVELTNQIMQIAASELKNYKTKLGGSFKIGLSSPNYVIDAERIEATFDGRRNGEPFSVHISSKASLAISELISFSTKIDYSHNRINGNVVDYIVTPSFLHQNIKKIILLLKAGFSGGLFQIQMNVVSSKKLIEAKENPEKFPNLVVRVWGFSAYFKDLPDVYKDLLIQRAIECEKAA